MPPPVTVERSRAIPVEIHQAYDGTLPAPLTTLFRRRYALLPPITGVREQVGPWGRVDQSRIIVTSDGGTMREVLTDLDPPHGFGYRLTVLTGPMRPLVDRVEGRWEFTPAGTGTLVTWRWVLQPRAAGAPVLPLITRMWLGYARQALEELSDLLVDPGPPGAP
jgi:hypothetical protein